MDLVGRVYEANVLMGLSFLALDLCQMVSHGGLDTAIPKREYVESYRSSRRAVGCVHPRLLSVTVQVPTVR